MIYTMTTNYRLWDLVNPGQVVFGATGVPGSQSIAGEGTGLQPCLYYDGNALAFLKSWFPTDTKVILKRLRVTIPQYRGVQYSVLPTSALVNPFTIRTNSPTGFIDNYVNILNFNEWIEINSIQESPVAGESFQFVIDTAQLLFCDFRNVQAIYDGIQPFAMVQLEIDSPLIPTVLP